MTSTPSDTTQSEARRKWRRRLALIYWSLSPLLFGVLVRLLSVPVLPLVASESVKQPPPWARWLMLAYFACTIVGAGAAMWFLWTRVREIPPPIST
jgi:hypothetical protein